MILENKNNYEDSKDFLRKFRNDIVGSIENKIEFLNNKEFNKYILLSLHRILEIFVICDEKSSLELLKILLDIVNSYIISK